MQKEAAKATTTLIEISVDGSSPMVPMRRALAMSSPFAESSHQLSAFGAESVGPGTSFRSNFLLGSSSPQVPSSSGSKVRTRASTSSGPPDKGQKLQSEMDKDSNQFGFAIVIEEDGKDDCCASTPVHLIPCAGTPAQAMPWTLSTKSLTPLFGALDCCYKKMMVNGSTIY